MEEELGLQAASEEAEADLYMSISEKQLVCSNLLGSFAPLIVNTLAATREDPAGDSSLRRSAVLALGKFMCISSQFCERHLQLLFTILTKSNDPSMRATIAVTLGDLASRFPNLIEPWTDYLYARLRDEVKGQISEVAMRLEDEDQRIKDLTGLFFHELAKR
ncbi:ncapd2, partial [Symbiodinium sp. KB8]